MSCGNQTRSVSKQPSQILCLSKPVWVPWSSGLGENPGYLPLTKAEDIKAESSKDLLGSKLKLTATK